MKIQDNTYRSHNFKAGLTSKIIKNAKSINPTAQEQFLSNQYGIETNFLNNSSAAFANIMCLKIFKTLLSKLRSNIILPPAIFTYEKSQLIEPDCAENFCIPDTCNILKNDYPFPGRSIFFQNFERLEEIDNQTESLHKNKISSSAHFLAPFIHEWLHSFHLDYIYRNLGYGGNCSYLQQIYPEQNKDTTGIQLLQQLEDKVLSQEENNIVFETLGLYSTLNKNQYLEVFSEAFTKFICASLSSGLEIVKNPLEELRKTSKDFQRILAKVWSLKNLN